MDEFGVLTERFGLKPQGKSAPMAGSRLPTNSSSSAAHPRTFGSNPKSSYNSSSFNGSSFNGGDDLFGNQKRQNFGGLGGDDLDMFGDFVKSSKQTNKISNGSSSFGYDPFFGNSSAKSSFEDDIFGGGISGSSSVNNVGGGVDDIFGSFASSNPKQQDSSPIDDLLGNFGGKSRTPPSRNGSVGFDDDLIPGFGSSGSANKSEPSKSAFIQPEDPFVVLESTSSSTKSISVDPLDEFTKFTQSGSSKATSSSNVSLPLRPPPKAGQVLKADKVKSSVSSSIDELEDFAMGRAQNNANGRSNVRQTKEVREKQSTKASKYREAEDAARKTQERSADDLESFFGMGTRSSSVPKSRTTNVDPLFDTMTSHRGKSDVDYGKSSSNSSGMRRTSSTTIMVDDFSSIFGDFPSSGEFKEIEGESEERRNARWKRHMRTNDRMERAVAKVKERELQNQQEQEERHRIADQLDVQITRWAAGKEGNMRALLSSLQYVLWAECGWEPVSLTELITSASVKKVYRRAALCLHPDKVLQKGATTEQKYIAEKVFNILKEAWTKFGKEELS